MNRRLLEEPLDDRLTIGIPGKRVVLTRGMVTQQILVSPDVLELMEMTVDGQP